MKKKKMKKNVLAVEFIICDECGFDRSCMILAFQANESFTWHCRECGQQWIGDINSKGEISAVKGNEKRDEQIILVKIDNGCFPMSLMVFRDTENLEEGRLKNYRLVLDELDNEINPQGFGQFIGVLS